jgi:hypothetical protein
VRDQQDGFGDVPHVALGEARLVVVDQRDDVAAGNVAMVGDDEPFAGRQIDVPRWSSRTACPGTSCRRCKPPRPSPSHRHPYDGRCGPPPSIARGNHSRSDTDTESGDRVIGGLGDSSGDLVNE